MLNVTEMLLMVVGVACVGVAVVAKMEGSNQTSSASKNLLFGTIVCVISLFAGSINMVLAGVLGSQVKLNSLDTMVYNAIPACIILVPWVFWYSHPINWPNHPPDTDWSILCEVLNRRPVVLVLALASGVLALAYNTLQFGIVQELSATHVAFAGNFNKACMVPLSFLCGLETLPAGTVESLFNLPSGPLLLAASFGSILAFAAYNMVSKGGEKKNSDKEAILVPQALDHLATEPEGTVRGLVYDLKDVEYAKALSWDDEAEAGTATPSTSCCSLASVSY